MKTRRGTDTAVGQRLAADANQEYRSAMRDCRMVLKSLDGALKKHEARQRNDEENWGYVGDLSHIRGEMLDLIRFIEGPA